MMKLLLVFLVGHMTYAASVEFKASATPGIKITAQCSGVTVLKAGEKFSAVVDVKSCDTHNNMRNGHMLQDLEAEKFPHATLVGERSANSFQGDLTIHGVKKQIKGSRDGEKISFDIKLSDFGVNRRTFLGAGVRDEVSIVGEF